MQPWGPHSRRLWVPTKVSHARAEDQFPSAGLEFALAGGSALSQLNRSLVFAPLLGAELARQGAPGRIINIGSTAGKIGVGIDEVLVVGVLGKKCACERRFADAIRSCNDVKLLGVSILPNLNAFVPPKREILASLETRFVSIAKLLD
jgi:hypothetical protein